MCDIQQWLTASPKWTTKHRNLIKVTQCTSHVVNVDEIVANSDNFNLQIPKETIRVKTLLDTVPRATLQRNIESTYPIIHEGALYLCAEFLLFKLKNGSTIEKNRYKGMSVLDFIERLLVKRAVCFVGWQDFYKFRDGTIGFEPNWEQIGTENETRPFILEDYLSYDELKLSALLSVSSYSHFINNGRRLNSGMVENRENLEPEGIIIGLIGTRLHKLNVMECQELVLSETQTSIRDWFRFSEAPNLLNVFYDFYEEPRCSYKNIKSGQVNNANRFIEIQNSLIFDNAVYAKRLAVSFDTLLIEANYRAQEREKFAYVHVVGIGLGVWRISNHQEKVFLETFGQRIRALGKNLNSISDFDFSYFSKDSNCLGYTDDTLFAIEGHPMGGIKIHFSHREPFSKLPTTDKLLVVSYAWDSNALPGNEFWEGSDGTSSDSSTAASSQVAELHNPFINPMVCATNLRVATTKGVVPAQQYLRQVIAKITDKLD